ncbi:hypothetical protein KR52_06750 [Synechococcus sp. KORDI-52]|nr:hypothetical protein KR52_06750 [Synechococcus sp. KORDI-52]
MSHHPIVLIPDRQAVVLVAPLGAGCALIGSTTWPFEGIGPVHGDGFSDAFSDAC